MPIAHWDNLSDETLLKVSQFLNTKNGPGLVGMSSSKWWPLVKQGKAPSPFYKDEHNTKWRLGDLRAWVMAQGDPTDLLAEIDPANDLQKLTNFETLMLTVHAPNVDFVRFEKAGHRGALTMIIGHRQGKVTKETFLWVPPKS